MIEIKNSLELILWFNKNMYEPLKEMYYSTKVIYFNCIRIQVMLSIKPVTAK